MIISILSFRVKEKQADRPETYEVILASDAMQSLPTDITVGETEMVKKIIQCIPQTIE